MDRKSEEQENFDRTVKLIDKSIEIFLKLSPLQQFGTVVTVSATSLYGIPRISPILRTLFIGFRSVIRGPQTKSLRSKDVFEIRKRVHNELQKTKDQFLVVRGPKGIGKTVAIENALAHTWSVCYVQNAIPPGMNKIQIVDQVLDDFTNIENRFLKKNKATKHVLFWNSFFTFLSGRHRKPIIVISAQERQKDQPHAQIAEAARELAFMGIRVIIDSSDGALFNHPLTKRELFIEMEPMPLDLIQKMPEIQELIDFLKKNNMYDETAAVLGGNPMDWKTLSAEWANKNDLESQIDMVKDFLVLQIKDAITARDEAIENNENMKNLLDQFVGKPATYQLDISKIKYYLGSKIPDIKSILRRSLDKIYKPATAAMSLVLRAGIEKNAEATFELITESVAKINKSI